MKIALNKGISKRDTYWYSPPEHGINPLTSIDLDKYVQNTWN